MRSKELIDALAQDCRTARTKVEDFFAALYDLTVVHLEKGEWVKIGSLGYLGLRPIIKDGRKEPVSALRFRPSPEFRARLKAVHPHWEVSEDLCVDCAKRPRKRELRCATCKNQRERERRENQKGAEAQARG